MGDFKVPENTGFRYFNERVVANSGRGRNTKTAELAANSRRDARRYVSTRLRTRNDSNSSASESSERYESNERYRTDGHLGSLRSPLRVGSQSDNRSGRWRETRNQDAAAYNRRTNLARETRDRYQLTSRSYRERTQLLRNVGYSDNKTGGRNPKLNEKTLQAKSSSNAPSWRADSVNDFPPLSELSELDWGVRVEREELMEELKHAKNSSRQLYQASDASGSSESLNQSQADKNLNFTPKRRFKDAELATPEVQEMLRRRQKQIDYGKNTECYENYLREVPRTQRTRLHPSTPDRHINYSRRGWDMIIKIWRKKLHAWDPQSDGKQPAVEDGEETSVLDDLTMSVLDATDENWELNDEDVKPEVKYLMMCSGKQPAAENDEETMSVLDVKSEIKSEIM